MTFVRRIHNRVTRGDFSRNVATVVAGTGLAQLVMILTSPILTRLYAPSDYGTWAVATSILSVLITISCLRYEYAIPLPVSDVEAANILALSLLINLVFSLCVGVALWLTGGLILAALGASALSPYWFLISIGQVGGGVVSVFINWAVRTKTFTEIAATRLLQSVSLVGVQVSLGLLGAGAVGLLAGDAAGRAAGSSRLARSAWRSDAAAFRQVSRVGIRAAAGRYRRFPIYSNASALLATLGAQVPVLMLVVGYGTETGGLFALAARVSAIPLTLIAGAVGQVFVAEAARLARWDSSELRNLFALTTIKLAKVAIVPSVAVGLVAPILAGPVFGGAWGDAGLFMAILVASYFMEFVVGATGDVLYVVERQDLQLLREVIRFAMLAGAVPVALWLGLPALSAVALLSGAGVVTYGLYGAITWVAVRNHVARSAPESRPTPGTPDPF